MIIKAAQRLNDVTTYYFARKLAEIDQMNKEENVPVLNLGIGSPDLLPSEEVISALNRGLEATDAHKYQSYMGIPSLRTAFANWYDTHFKIKI